jgi:hypothetical protein
MFDGMFNHDIFTHFVEQRGYDKVNALHRIRESIQADGRRGLKDQREDDVIIMTFCIAPVDGSWGSLYVWIIYLLRYLSVSAEGIAFTSNRFETFDH